MEKTKKTFAMFQDSTKTNYYMLNQEEKVKFISEIKGLEVV